MSERLPTSILVVDDEADMRILIRVVIDVANHGLAVVGEATDGIEAVTAWRALAGSSGPDVIVLDNRMPHLSGIEAAAIILADHPDQIIVLCSAFLDDEVRAEALAVGIATCVSKDNVQQLPEVIWSLRAA